MQWVAGVTFRLDLFFMQCLGPSAPRILKWRSVFSPSHSKNWCVQITFILYVVLRTFSPPIVKQPDVRFDLFLMQCLQSLAPFFLKQCNVKSVLFYTLCSGPLAPRILKQWGVYTVQNIFISDIVLGFSSPLHSEMVECSRCWGVQISFIYMQCSGPLAPFFLKQWLFKLSSDIFEVLKSYLLFETFRSCAVGVYQFQMGHPAPPKKTTKF